MKLSLKQKALIQTVAIIVAVVAGSLLGTIAIHVIPAIAYPYIALAGLLIVFGYLMYNVVLSRLEYQETLKNLNETAKG